MTAVVILTAAIVFLVALWVLVPIGYGVPWRATSKDRIRDALRLAELKPGETVYDLGSGDGRVLILAAREFGACGVGIEVGPVQVALSVAMILLNGVRSNVRVKRENFFTADLREADVVFAYLTSDPTRRLQDRFKEQLRDGARIVTVAFDLPDWQPQEFDRENLIFLYRMPPKEGILTSFLGSQK